MWFRPKSARPDAGRCSPGDLKDLQSWSPSNDEEPLFVDRGTPGKSELSFDLITAPGLVGVAQPVIGDLGAQSFGEEVSGHLQIRDRDAGVLNRAGQRSEPVRLRSIRGDIPAETLRRTAQVLAETLTG